MTRDDANITAAYIGEESAYMTRSDDPMTAAAGELLYQVARLMRKAPPDVLYDCQAITETALGAARAHRRQRVRP